VGFNRSLKYRLPRNHQSTPKLHAGGTKDGQDITNFTISKSSFVTPLFRAGGSQLQTPPARNHQSTTNLHAGGMKTNHHVSNSEVT